MGVVGDLRELLGFRIRQGRYSSNISNLNIALNVTAGIKAQDQIYIQVEGSGLRQVCLALHQGVFATTYKLQLTVY